MRSPRCVVLFVNVSGTTKWISNLWVGPLNAFAFHVSMFSSRGHSFRGWTIKWTIKCWGGAIKLISKFRGGTTKSQVSPPLSGPLICGWDHSTRLRCVCFQCVCAGPLSGGHLVAGLLAFASGCSWRRDCCRRGLLTCGGFDVSAHEEHFEASFFCLEHGVQNPLATSSGTSPDVHTLSVISCGVSFGC